MTIRVTVPMDEAIWRGLRRLAENRRDGGGRASIAGVVRALIEREVRAFRLPADATSGGRSNG